MKTKTSGYDDSLRAEVKKPGTQINDELAAAIGSFIENRLLDTNANIDVKPES